jgi:hypothetical protein
LFLVECYMRQLECSLKVRDHWGNFDKVDGLVSEWFGGHTEWRISVLIHMFFLCMLVLPEKLPWFQAVLMGKRFTWHASAC